MQSGIIKKSDGGNQFKLTETMKNIIAGCRYASGDNYIPIPFLLTKQSN